MDRDQFREIVSAHLLPLFSGAQLIDGFQQWASGRATVRRHGAQEIWLKLHQADDWRVTLRRNPRFSPSTAPFVTERRVVQSFVDVLESLEGTIGTTAECDVVSSLSKRVAARAICEDEQLESRVLSIIDHLDTLSNRVYEGQRIAFSVGLDRVRPRVTIAHSDVWSEDYSTVLTNGLDTILVISPQGKVEGHESLSLPQKPPEFVPLRLAPIAAWTKSSQDRIALTLNRMGEILIVKDGRMVFARRSGRWHFLTHEPVIRQMKCPHDDAVRRAVYASCIDASFARTGACVGIMTSGDVGKLNDIAPKDADHIRQLTSPKAKFLSKLIAKRAFQDLDRRLRLELLSVDGATILSHIGELLAVGAILQIPGGSSGGGRLAAAVALSRYGTGIKVSQDGSITGFHRCPNPDSDNPKEAFVVM